MLKTLFVVCVLFCVSFAQEKSEPKETLAAKLWRQLSPNALMQLSKSTVSNISRVVSQFGKNDAVDPSELLDEFLKDPYPVNDFNLSSHKDLLTIDAQFKEMQLRGLRNMIVESMKFNLVDIHLQAAIKIPILKLNGTYNLNGKVTFFRLSGKGAFWMTMKDVVIHAAASLNKTRTGELKVADIALDVHTDNIKVHFDNLMGGSGWSSVYNTILNTISNLMFDEVKHILLNEMQTEIKQRIDDKLLQLPKHLPHENSSTLFDTLLERSKAAIANKYEPFYLPDHTKQFSHRVYKYNLTGDLKLYSGKIHGLMTLSRTGEIIAEYSNDSLTIEADLGFDNLTAGYGWSAKLMSVGPSGAASLSVNSVSAHMKLRQSLIRGSLPALEQFKINQIKHIWVDVRGLGTIDFLMEIFINLISNTFKKSLAQVISGPVRDAIQKELDNLPFAVV